MDFAIQHSEYLALALQRDALEEEPSKENLYSVGTVARITHSVRLQNGDIKVRLHVQGRFEIRSFAKVKPFIQVRVRYVDDESHVKLNSRQEKLMTSVKEKFTLLTKHDENVDEGIILGDEFFEPGIVADFIASHLSLGLEEGQELLETFESFERLRAVEKLLYARLDELNIRERIFKKARAELGRGEHENLLREQLRQIQAELGEKVDEEDELVQLKSEISKLKMPPEAKTESERQLRRLQQMHPDSSEAALLRTYLSWMVEIPWSKRTKDSVDLRKAKELLDQDHFGLDIPKERILDFLGVRKLQGNMRGPILLFVGPPGVGKTSLGRSIALALGRSFVRVSLGGLRDEAEIRGHRRTYVGAMPGRIIQGLKTAGTRNPVFMLDEIDKVGSDFRGDPSSVLLEVLDPEQNKGYEDHYLNVPFDLSEVMFIATANVTDTIPPALLDRMEIIEISGYTTEEKVEIAKRYLIPREKEENGLGKKSIPFSKETLLKIIDSYTQESGVRDFRRNVGAVFRKIARLVADGKRTPKRVTPELVEQFLGIPKFLPDNRLHLDQIGIVTGLAWTSVGGRLLHVEVASTKGKGTLSLTGHLGEVMRESAMAALTYVMSHAKALGVDENFYEQTNIHVHVSQGAIPKDGPSAGISIAVGLVSLLTDRPVSKKVAMTGEITLGGRVLAIGGLKEKALAALRGGISVVIIPKENEPELEEFPKYLLQKVRFIAVENISEALEVALIEKRPTRMKRKRPPQFEMVE